MRPCEEASGHPAFPRDECQSCDLHSPWAPGTPHPTTGRLLHALHVSPRLVPQEQGPIVMDYLSGMPVW